ncbi:galactokinase [soil metagenome]
MTEHRSRDRAIATFRERFGRYPEVLVRSPGRVNLIGEHTDYNDGFVLPVAIEHALWLAAMPSDDSTVTLVSDDAGGEVVVDPAAIGTRLDGWGAYVQGVVWAMREAGVPVTGVVGAVASDVPAGAGLSSSAALEMAVCRALAFDGPWDPVAAAKLGRRAENAWVGVASGILDQLSSAAALAGHALLIDCRSLAIDHIPLPQGLIVVIMDTTTRRELAGSPYNDRRAECAAAADALGVASLRDADLAQVEALDDDVLRRRARHVVSEHARTSEAAGALRDGDIEALGPLLADAHSSMRDDFEASGPELDQIVACAVAAPGCVGARMTGGGFAGCAVALVEVAAVDAYAAAVTDAFRDATGLTPRLHVTAATAGTERVS